MNDREGGAARTIFTGVDEAKRRRKKINKSKTTKEKQKNEDRTNKEKHKKITQNILLVHVTHFAPSF